MEEDLKLHLENEPADEIITEEENANAESLTRQRARNRWAGFRVLEKVKEKMNLAKTGAEMIADSLKEKREKIKKGLKRTVAMAALVVQLGVPGGGAKNESKAEDATYEPKIGMAGSEWTTAEGVRVRNGMVVNDEAGQETIVGDAEEADEGDWSMVEGTGEVSGEETGIGAEEGDVAAVSEAEEVVDETPENVEATKVENDEEDWSIEDSINEVIEKENDWLAEYGIKWTGEYVKNTVNEEGEWEPVKIYEPIDGDYDVEYDSAYVDYEDKKDSKSFGTEIVVGDIARNICCSPRIMAEYRMLLGFEQFASKTEENEWAEKYEAMTDAERLELKKATLEQWYLFLGDKTLKNKDGWTLRSMTPTKFKEGGDGEEEIRESRLDGELANSGKDVILVIEDPNGDKLDDGQVKINTAVAAGVDPSKYGELGINLTRGGELWWRKGKKKKQVQVTKQQTPAAETTTVVERPVEVEKETLIEREEPSIEERKEEPKKEEPRKEEPPKEEPPKEEPPKVEPKPEPVTPPSVVVEPKNEENIVRVEQEAEDHRDEDLSVENIGEEGGGNGGEATTESNPGEVTERPEEVVERSTEPEEGPANEAELQGTNELGFY